MGHRTETDYRVEEVEQDIWSCDFCERDIEKEKNIHVFAVDPKVKFSYRRTSEQLVWLNEQEGKTAVSEGTRISSQLDGHICKECIKNSSLSKTERVRGYVVACLRKLRLR